MFGYFTSQDVGSDQAADPKWRSDPPFSGLGSNSGDLIHRVGKELKNFICFEAILGDKVKYF